jgi:hypothetical protein
MAKQSSSNSGFSSVKRTVQYSRKKKKHRSVVSDPSPRAAGRGTAEKKKTTGPMVQTVLDKQVIPTLFELNIKCTTSSTKDTDRNCIFLKIIYVLKIKDK